MSNLRRNTRLAHQSGTQLYATVESIKYGYATVRINGNGARLTNIPTVGGVISQGDTVIVDYSSATPKVRAITAIPPAVTESVSKETFPLEAPIFQGGDHSCRVRRTGGMVNIPHDTWTTVNFTTMEFDTDSFWSSTNPERLTAVASGVYQIIVRIGWDKTPLDKPMAIMGGNVYVDWTAQKIEPFFIQIVHSGTGVIAMDCNYPIWSGEGYLVWDLTALTPMAVNEYIYVQVKHQNEAAEVRKLHCDPYGLYPRLQWQWMGNT